MSVCMSAGMNTITLSVSALQLDMDGTLICSTGDVEKVWRLWCQYHQLAPEPVLAMCHGMRSREVIRALALQLDVEREAAWLDELEMLHTGGDAIAGAGELLRRLPPERWAIVTSASERVARHRLNCAGLPLPAVLVGAEAVINGKPDPNPICWALCGLASRPLAVWYLRMPRPVLRAPCVQAAPWCR